MGSRDWFVVGARLIGVWIFYSAVSYFAAYVDIRLAQALGYRPVVPNGGYEGGYLVQGIIYLALSLYLLLGTGHLAGFCYGDDGLRKEDLHGPAEVPAEQRLTDISA